MAFVDDLLIFSNSMEEHVSHVRSVLQRLQACGLKADPDKSLFGTDCVEYLGTTCPLMASPPVPARCTPFWPCLPPSQ
jgi:hypothetical protein